MSLLLVISLLLTSARADPSKSTLWTSLCGASLISSQTAWVSLPIKVPMNMADNVFNNPLVPTLYGTPPQLINATLDLNTAKVVVYSSSCVLCSGNTSFDPTLSTTFQVFSIHIHHHQRPTPQNIGAELSMAVQYGRLFRKYEQ